MGISVDLKKRIFLFKFSIYKKSSLDFYKKLLSNHRKSRDELKSHQFNEFLKILNFAYSNSSFYRRKYDKVNFKPDSVKSLNDIENVPILTKGEIQKNLENILTTTKDNQNLVLGATGGSTGSPMAYYFDKSLPYEAFAWRYLHWWGVKPWDDGVFIWRMKRKKKLKKILNYLSWWPVKKIRVDAKILDERKCHYLTSKINRYKPTLIQGYVGAIYEYALYLHNNKLKVHSPKAIWVTSAPLTKNQRNLIESVFNSPLYNEYGSSEIPWIAAQCNQKEYLHINDEGRLVEIINKDDKGYGDIVITDLLNRRFPLIRYDIGDRSKFINDNCKCGSHLSLIEDVKGRKSDFFIIPNYGKIDGSFLTTIFDSYPNSIFGFQLIQHQDYNITLKVVPNKENSNWKSEVLTVKSELEKLVNGGVQINLEYCKELKSEAGKTRFIIRE